MTFVRLAQEIVDGPPSPAMTGSNGLIASFVFTRRLSACVEIAASIGAWPPPSSGSAKAAAVPLARRFVYFPVGPSGHVREGDSRSRLTATSIGRAPLGRCGPGVGGVQTTHDKGSTRMDLKDHIRSIPDFPKPGILFYDIATLLRDADAWQVAMGRMARAVRPHLPDMVAGIESRGFLVAAPLALKLGCGFIMMRKPGKLPGPTVSESYALEYGEDRLEIQADAIQPGQRVVIVDDLLATGGTLAAGVRLLRHRGAIVPAVAALIELTFLNGRSRLDVPCEALVTYDS